MSGGQRNYLHVGDPGYGPTCDCGRSKNPMSFRCRLCDEGRRMGGTIYTLGRSESIITFARGPNVRVASKRLGARHEIVAAGRGATIRSLHCFGTGEAAQIQDGLRRLEGDGWQVLSRSTPAKILTDLRRQFA